MNIIKTLLFALLASILFFVYLEYEKTNNSLLITEGGKPKYGHTIYRDGKQIHISNEEYAKLRAIPAINSISNSKENTPEKKEIKTLKLAGQIPEGVSYKVKVYYESDSKGIVCGKVGFDLGWWSGDPGFYLTESTKSLTYEPIIENGKHSIEIPLDEFSLLVGCSYHFYTIQMEITNNNLDSKYKNYQGRFTLFSPEERLLKNTYSGDFHNHHVGQTINMECMAKDWTDKISFIPPNCHLEAFADTFFPAQGLKYEAYNLNISTTTQNEYELKRFLYSNEYHSKVNFISRVFRFPNFYNQKISSFNEKRELLKKYHRKIRNYLNEIKSGIENILTEQENRLSEKDIKLLKNKLKVVQKSIESHIKVEAMEKKFLYDPKDIASLDELNQKVKIDKLFLDNEFYKYEMLHLIKLSIKDPNIIYYELNNRNTHVGSSLSYPFLNCRKLDSIVCQELKKITNDEKEADKKLLLKKIGAIKTFLFLKPRRNLPYFMREWDRLGKE